MKFLSRIVWSEGMHLAPHHFQAQTRYFEDSLRFATASLWHEISGFLDLEMDRDSIRNGTVAVRHVRGVFPDGLSFDMPECDPLPAPRNIAEVFPPTADRIVVCLAIPNRAWNAQNCTVEPNGGGSSTRFLGDVQLLYDETTGRDEKPVRLGRKNIRLLLESEVSEEMVSLPLVRVMRDGTGHFAFDDKFIPPVLRISANDRLLTMVQRLTEILEDKSSAMAGSGKGSRFQPGMSTGEIANFWFLHTVNSALSALRHLVATRTSHPEEVYREMARLGGALCTFGLDVHPRSLPVYDHRNLESCFERLDDHIRKHLEIVVPTRTLVIPLTRFEKYFFDGEVSDSRCFGTGRWILGVHAAMGVAQLIQEVPLLVKFCSAKFVPELVKRALPGLQLDHLTVAPSAISARVDYEYFAVTRTGPCWEHIMQTKHVGVYVPGEIPDVELELLAVLES